MGFCSFDDHRNSRGSVLSTDSVVNGMKRRFFARLSQKSAASRSYTVVAAPYTEIVKAQLRVHIDASFEHLENTLKLVELEHDEWTAKSVAPGWLSGRSFRRDVTLAYEPVSSTVALRGLLGRLPWSLLIADFRARHSSTRFS